MILLHCRQVILSLLKLYRDFPMVHHFEERRSLHAFCLDRILTHRTSIIFFLVQTLSRNWNSFWAINFGQFFTWHPIKMLLKATTKISRKTQTLILVIYLSHDVTDLRRKCWCFNLTSAIVARFGKHLLWDRLLQHFVTNEQICASCLIQFLNFLL